MRTTALFSLAAALLGAVSFSLAAPPRVISATPDNADLGVDPAMTQLRIQFDQDMDPSGRSICGGGPSFPRINGTPTWIDSRTIAITVALEPGKTYALSVNCTAARNFANTKGESAESYPISFTTRKADEPAPALTAEEAAKAAATLRKAIDNRYSYRDLRKVDWDKAFADHKDALESARTPSAFARAAAKLLAVAGDMHVTVRVGDMVLGTHRAAAPSNVDLTLLSKIVKEWKRPSNRIATGTIDGIPYLLIGDWSGAAKEYEPAFDFIKQHQAAPAMIIDVRTNSGGDELLARSVAGCFADKPIVYSRNKSRDASLPGGWTEVLDRTLTPTPDRPRFAGPLVVLIGKQCMSSNESFIAMLKHGASGGATLIGDSTYGSSGNPRPVELCPNVRVLLPTWIDLLPDGTPLEGKGVSPDIRVEWKPMPTSDPILDAAVKHLKKN